MQKTAEESAGQGRRAVGALLGSAFMFSLMTLGVKQLGTRLPVAELVLARSIVGLSISLAMARLIGINPWGRRRGLLALRGLPADAVRVRPGAAGAGRPGGRQL